METIDDIQIKAIFRLLLGLFFVALCLLPFFSKYSKRLEKIGCLMLPSYVLAMLMLGDLGIWLEAFAPETAYARDRGFADMCALVYYYGQGLVGSDWHASIIDVADDYTVILSHCLNY